MLELYSYIVNNKYKKPVMQRTAGKVSYR